MADASKGAAAKASKRAHGAKDDAIALLAHDHADVRDLFAEYDELAADQADGEERQALAEQICAMLTAHATIEEEIFYPAARDAGVGGDLLDEAEVEHAAAKDLIAQIRAMSPDDDLYDAKVKVLGEYIDHHVDEEEGEIFPRCREAKMDLAALGATLAERKSELLAEAPA
jgi:hemerythrin superfamily protein